MKQTQTILLSLLALGLGSAAGSLFNRAPASAGKTASGVGSPASAPIAEILTAATALDPSGASRPDAASEYESPAARASVLEHVRGLIARLPLPEAIAGITNSVLAELERDPAAAMRLIANLDLSNPSAMSCVENAIRLFAQNDPQAADRVFASGVGTLSAERAERSILLGWAAKNPARAIEELNTRQPTMTENFSANFFRTLAKSQPTMAVEAAMSIADANSRVHALFGALQEWVTNAQDPSQALAWIESNDNRLLRLQALRLAGVYWAARDPVAAATFTSSIREPDLRAQYFKHWYENWSNRDPAAAKNWVQTASIPEELKTLAK